MGIVKKDDVTQSKLEIEPNLELPNELPDTCNFQYNEVKKALKEFIKSYQAYLDCKDKLDEKKASLQTQTDWSNIFTDKKATVADKEAHISLVTMEQRILKHELYVDKLYKEELYKLEVMRYEKE